VLEFSNRILHIFLALLQPCKSAPTVRNHHLPVIIPYKWLLIWFHSTICFCFPLQALTIESSSGVKVSGLTIQNSQQMNFIIARSDSVRVSKVMVSSPGDSPNTDGIHITGSTNVILQDCKIGTGFFSFDQTFMQMKHFTLQLRL